jgi:hypothetical protein
MSPFNANASTNVTAHPRATSSVPMRQRLHTNSVNFPGESARFSVRSFQHENTGVSLRAMTSMECHRSLTFQTEVLGAETNRSVADHWRKDKLDAGCMAAFSTAWRNPRSDIRLDYDIRSRGDVVF